MDLWFVSSSRFIKPMLVIYAVVLAMIILSCAWFRNWCMLNNWVYNYCSLLMILIQTHCVTGQGNEASRSYYQGQRPDPRMAMEKQGSYDARSQPRADEMERYEENPLRHTLEGLEQKFLNDIMKLSKEQNDAEDAEIARHREVSSTAVRLTTLCCNVILSKANVKRMHGSRRNFSWLV